MTAAYPPPVRQHVCLPNRLRLHIAIFYLLYLHRRAACARRRRPGSRRRRRNPPPLPASPTSPPAAPSAAPPASAAGPPSPGRRRATPRPPPRRAPATRRAGRLGCQRRRRRTRRRQRRTPASRARAPAPPPAPRGAPRRRCAAPPRPQRAARSPPDWPAPRLAGACIGLFFPSGRLAPARAKSAAVLAAAAAAAKRAPRLRERAVTFVRIPAAPAAAPRAHWLCLGQREWRGGRGAVRVWTVAHTRALTGQRPKIHFKYIAAGCLGTGGDCLSRPGGV